MSGVAYPSGYAQVDELLKARGAEPTSTIPLWTHVAKGHTVSVRSGRIPSADRAEPT